MPNVSSPSSEHKLGSCSLPKRFNPKQQWEHGQWMCKLSVRPERMESKGKIGGFCLARVVVVSLLQCFVCRRVFPAAACLQSKLSGHLFGRGRNLLPDFNCSY